MVRGRSYRRHQRERWLNRTRWIAVTYWGYGKGSMFPLRGREPSPPEWTEEDEQMVLRRLKARSVHGRHCRCKKKYWHTKRKEERLWMRRWEQEGRSAPSASDPTPRSSVPSVEGRSGRSRLAQAVMAQVSSVIGHFRRFGSRWLRSQLSMMPRTTGRPVKGARAATWRLVMGERESKGAMSARGSVPTTSATSSTPSPTGW